MAKIKNFEIQINPLLDIYFQKDNLSEDILIRNTRGFQAKGKIGKKWYFYSDFHENQATFPKYFDDYLYDTIVPSGQGYPKFNGNSRDFAASTGHLKYMPTEYFELQIGHGNHFLGEGYRSLLLSDNQFNYPYLRLSLDFGRLDYWVLYSIMKDVSHKYADRIFFNKYVTSHYLSFNFTNKLQFAIFETVVYGDESGDRNYDLNYLNPVIFFRPVEFALGSSGGNVLMGLNGKYQINNNWVTYGQMILDEFKLDEIKNKTGWWANKYGFQLGVKSNKFFIDNLNFLVEYNYVRPFTYSHRNSTQNYGHYKLLFSRSIYPKI